MAKPDRITAIVSQNGNAYAPQFREKRFPLIFAETLRK
jgi:hypothetical protein